MSMKYVVQLSVFSLGLTFGLQPCFGSATDDANSTSSAAGMSVISNVAMGASMMAVCVTPTGQWACPMAAMSLLQAAMTGGSKSSADQVAKEFDSNIGSGDFTYGDLKPVTYGGQTYTPQQLKAMQLGAVKDLEKLKSMGFEVDPKTGMVTTPKGKVPASSFGSGSAMASAGLIDPSEISEVDATLKKASNISVVSMPGAGGGGGSSGGGKSDYSDSAFAFNFGAGAGQREPAAAKTTGLTKNFGGDPIGISTDNIFDMVHRNYQRKVKERMFVE